MHKNKNSVYIFLILISALLERFKDGELRGEPNINNTNKYIVMECKNDPTGGIPYWEPSYDHLIQPFPECIKLRKYIFLVCD